MLVVGLNQTIDRTVHLPLLAPGDVLRAVDAAVTPGGKAVNVCRAVLTLEGSARLVGPFPGRLGRVAVEMLRAEGLQVIAVPVSGELRGTTVIIESGGRTTVINEPGPELGGAEWTDVLAAIGEAIGDGDVVAISGSVPPGVGEGAHRNLIELVHERRGTVAVDVTSARLIEAATAGADLVSPNLAEAEQALGIIGTPGPGAEPVDLDHLTAVEIETRSRMAARSLVEAGAGAAMVSAGRHGLACRSATFDGFVPAPAVHLVNPIGAGDALLGATLAGLEGGETFEGAVRHGVAFAAASVAHPVAGYADPGLVSELTAITVAGSAAEGVR